MKCFNCGDDAEMKVMVLIDGKIQEVNICANCYKDHMQRMMDEFSDDSGNFNPEEMQKFLLNIIKNNKDEFENLFGNLIEQANINPDDIKPEDIDFEIGSFEDFAGEMGDVDLKVVLENMKDFHKKDPFEGKKEVYSQADFRETKSDREIKMLKSSVNKKKKQLRDYVDAEDYLAAASVRDQIKDINKRIMIIMELEKENER